MLSITIRPTHYNHRPLLSLTRKTNSAKTNLLFQPSLSHPNHKNTHLSPSHHNLLIDLFSHPFRQL